MRGHELVTSVSILLPFSLCRGVYHVHVQGDYVASKKLLWVVTLPEQCSPLIYPYAMKPDIQAWFHSHSTTYVASGEFWIVPRRERNPSKLKFLSIHLYLFVYGFTLPRSPCTSESRNLCCLHWVKIYFLKHIHLLFFSTSFSRCSFICCNKSYTEKDINRVNKQPQTTRYAVIPLITL